MHLEGEVRQMVDRAETLTPLCEFRLRSPSVREKYFYPFTLFDLAVTAITEVFRKVWFTHNLCQGL